MSKKLIRLTENDIHRIVKESVEKILKEEQDIEFSNDCQMLYNLLDDVCGGDEIRETMIQMSDIDFDDDGNIIENWIYDKRIMLYLLRDIVNYDLIDIFSTQGEINVENSNHPDIAQILQKYYSPDEIERVRNSF